MNFIKSLFQPNPEEEINCFWASYSAIVNVYQRLKPSTEFVLFMENCRTFFLQSQEDHYSYQLVVSSRKDDECYSFKISKKMQPQFDLRPENNTVVYFLAIDDNLQLMFEFRILNDNFSDSKLFKEILSRLIYEAERKRKSITIEDETIFDQIIKKVD